jgi:hypothetical protein
MHVRPETAGTGAQPRDQAASASCLTRAPEHIRKDDQGVRYAVLLRSGCGRAPNADYEPRRCRPGIPGACAPIIRLCAPPGHLAGQPYRGISGYLAFCWLRSCSRRMSACPWCWASWRSTWRYYPAQRERPRRLPCSRSSSSGDAVRGGMTRMPRGAPGGRRPRRIRVSPPHRRPTGGMINSRNLSAKADQAHGAASWTSGTVTYSLATLVLQTLRAARERWTSDVRR